MALPILLGDLAAGTLALGAVALWGLALALLVP
jgi:hypothetical protein